MLWPLERRTIPPEALRAGLVAGRFADKATWVLGACAIAALWPLHGLWALVLALPLARLAVLDAAAYLLPHLYTLPLIGMGMAWGEGWHVWPWVVGLLLGREVMLRWPRPIGLSGGDFTLLAAMVAWLPLHQACAAAAVGCVLFLPLTFMFPKRDVPLGVPLIMGWLVFSALAALPMTHDWPIYLP